MSLLQVEGLHVSFTTRHGVVEALHGIDLGGDDGARCLAVRRRCAEGRVWKMDSTSWNARSAST